MASSVAQPLERQFAQIPGVSQTTSSSGLGIDHLVVQFDLDRNIDAAANDIQAAINAASGQLPRELPAPPTYRKVNPADSPILLLSVTSDSLPLTEVDDNADTKLAQQISQISGVGQVSIGGEQKPAIRIQLDPAKLVAKDISLEDVRAPAGDHHRQHAQGQHRRRGAQLHHLRQRPADRRRQLERRDHRLPQRRAAAHPRHRAGRGRARRMPRRLPGRPASAACSSIIFKQPGANVIETVDRIKARAAAPAGGDAARHSRWASSAIARRRSGPRWRTSSSHCC